MQQRNTQARMPKAQALALLRQIKRGIVIASFLGFGTFSALVMSHTVGATAQQTTTVTHKTTAVTPTVTTPVATATTPAAPTATATPQGGGYGFGSNPSSTPVSGTHTS